MKSLYLVLKETLIIVNLALAALIMATLIYVSASLVTRFGHTAVPPVPTPAPLVTASPDSADCAAMRAAGADANALRARGCPTD